MSHIHIPDGVLPAWIVLAGWVVTGGLLVLATRRVSQSQVIRRLPLLGVVSALMIVGMTAEIVPIAYHTNMSIVAGIILGPFLGFIAAFIVDLIVGLFGHGGITVVGLNTLVIGSEITLGYLLFQGFKRLLGYRPEVTLGRPGLASAAAAFLTLIVSTTLMIAIVAASNVNPAAQAQIAAEPGKISFSNPFGGGVLAFEVSPEKEVPQQKTDIGTFARLVYALGFFGWVIESVVTGLIIGYVGRVRPDLISLKRLKPAREARE